MLRTTILLIALAAIHPAKDPGRLLYEAAAGNDRPKFETVLESARSTVEKMRLGDARNRLRHAIIAATDLDRVWRFDGIYWDEDSLPDYYDRLAGEYPGFEAFIAQYRVIDHSGRVLYPKQETREFLVKSLRPANSAKHRP